MQDRQQRPGRARWVSSAACTALRCSGDNPGAPCGRTFSGICSAALRIAYVPRLIPGQMCFEKHNAVLIQITLLLTIVQNVAV
jgi:hypothetical protein